MQEHWSGSPFLSPGDLPDPGNQPGSPALQADSLPSEPPGNKHKYWNISQNPITILTFILASNYHLDKEIFTNFTDEDTDY